VGRDARPGSVPTVRVLVIDNYDSFVYNLVQYLGELGAEPVVHRNDAVTLEQLRAVAPDAVLVSPGPGSPDERAHDSA
jgi:anthranilate/para-aminobenzoate synthase component II